LVQQAWQVCLLEAGPGYVALNQERLANQPVALQRYRSPGGGPAAPGLAGYRVRSSRTSLEYLANPERSAQIDWIAGLRLASEAGRLLIADWQAELPRRVAAAP
jgi:hypothetical protein